MPKLRNADTDLGKFAQWLGRKCRNHNPLQELKLPSREREGLQNVYKASGKGDVKVRVDNPGVVVYEAGGRVFEITVQEVDPEQYENVELQAVGF